ncbi:MAG: GIY-YIG nuclease family protein, partial [Micromonosporaceae bacterium]|nr:GIY-YIG nuclease family protein [Micromonosporaceae bacterium]
MKRTLSPIDCGEIKIRPEAAYVYIAEDVDGRVLYVGLTDDLGHRLGQHSSHHAPWYRLACRIRWELYPDRSAAARAEYAYIRQLDPVHNIVHKTRIPDVGTATFPVED